MTGVQTCALPIYLAVLLTYVVPAWRGRAPLSSAQRSLLVIAVATLPFMSFLRSSVLTLNDFGFRSALLLQFPLLLLGAEALTRWNLEDLHRNASAISTSLRQTTPRWLRSIAAFALVLGAIGTVSQALWFRFVVLFAEVGNMHAGRGGNLSHNAWISATGYAQLDATIPRDAIVQFDPTPQEPNWITADLLGVAHQTAIIFDQQGCGSELGGDPSGCPVMAVALNTLFKGATAEQARATCHQFGIQYLVARVYDPAWKSKSTWVWTLNPVVSYDEFRALDCQQ